LVDWDTEEPHNGPVHLLPCREVFSTYKRAGFRRPTTGLKT
jgi:hypothetical protein